MSEVRMSAIVSGMKGDASQVVDDNCIQRTFRCPCFPAAVNACVTSSAHLTHPSDVPPRDRGTAVSPDIHLLAYSLPAQLARKDQLKYVTSNPFVTTVSSGTRHVGGSLPSPM